MGTADLLGQKSHLCDDSVPRAVRIVVGCLAASLAFLSGARSPLPTFCPPRLPLGLTKLLQGQNAPCCEQRVLGSLQRPREPLCFRSGLRPHLEALASGFGF